MKYFWTLAAALLLMLTACSKDDKEEKADYTKIRATRAVMIYMAGENNLTYHAGNGYRALQADLKEIVEGSKQLADNQRLFVFVDSLGTNNNHKGKPYIIEVHGGEIHERKAFDSEFYSCDPDHFREIVSWMTSNIQADGFGLVLWGHSTGWSVDPDSIATSGRRAYGWDTNEDTGSKADKWMNYTQMAQALSSLPKFDFILGDCCNIVSAEIGYELRNATKYLIGSPAEIPGPGAPYDIIIPKFFTNRSALYQGIIDSYYEYYKLEYSYQSTYFYGYSLPMAVVETQYIEQLAQATRQVVETFAPKYPEVLDLAGIPFYSYLDDPCMYDMKAVIKRYASASDFDKWERACKLAVPYARMSMKWMSNFEKLRNSFAYFDQNEAACACISMYFPQNYTAYDSGDFKYNKTANNFGWNRVVDWKRFGWE